MKINWKVRAKNQYFWLALVPLCLLLVQQVMAIFGVRVEIAALSEQLKAIIYTVFGILALVGVVVDPTTKGASDSDLAMSYEEPGGDETKHSD